MALLFILNAVDPDGNVYDESIFEPSYFSAGEHGSDAAAEAAAVEGFESAVGLGPWPGWVLLRVGSPDEVADREASPVAG
ncbi:hypothetical protein F3K32_42745 [Streptomyces sp. LBUM 1483]|uniref:hypothetical protein n=1 Tax=Streptomyces scabiei TaxID=1930 RepID=UPI001B32FFB2|nr:hypothetical protein [Streptomyces sp. LBUM 1483]MBP5926728.1 hypothetical protein [Streptomyces sp. LBUM 1483]